MPMRSGDREQVAPGEDLVDARSSDLVETRLRAAVAARQLTLHYQPIVDLPDGSLLGYEALLRWRDPVLGQVPPNRFVPVAERSGLIGDLGTWVLRTACSTAAAWPARPGAPLPSVSVNVSPRQLADDTFATRVTQALTDAGLEPDRLCLEITETAAIQDLDATRARLAAVTALGVRLALDDFGTGYASLTMLRALPFDTVKIDRSFVANVTHSATDTVLLRLIVDAAHALGQRVCAEGVETAEQARQVIAIGADHAQGWLYGRPEPDSPALRHRMCAPPDDCAPGGAEHPLLLGASDEMVLITSPADVITYASASCNDILGVPSSDLIGDLLPARLDRATDDPADDGDRWQWLREEEVPHSARHRDGSLRWLAVRTQSVRDQSGATREVLRTARDVTATVLARQALRDSERQFEHAFDDALAGMALSTVDGRLVRVNRAFAELIGYTPDQLTRRTVADLTPARYRRSDDTNTRRLLDGSVPRVDVIKKYHHAAGHLVAVHVRATVVHSGPDGGDPYILAHILPEELDRARRSRLRMPPPPRRTHTRV